MNSLLYRAVLAVLPILGLTLEVKSSFIYGALGFFIFLAATTLFLIIRRVIPRPLHRLSFFLLILVLGMEGGISFLLISLFILVLPDFFREQQDWRRLAVKTFGLALSFWALLVGHALLSEGLGIQMGWRFFQLPSGSYFMAGILFTVFPLARRKK